MHVRRLAVAYGTLVALAVLGFWTTYLLQGDVLGVVPARDAVGFHIAAEGVSAVLMATAAWAVATDHPRDRELLMAGLGSILYAAVNAWGLYEEGWVLVPIVLSIPATLGLGLLALDDDRWTRSPPS